MHHIYMDNYSILC